MSKVERLTLNAEKIERERLNLDNQETNRKRERDSYCERVTGCNAREKVLSVIEVIDRGGARSSVYFIFIRPTSPTSLFASRRLMQHF